MQEKSTDTRTRASIDSHHLIFAGALVVFVFLVFEGLLLLTQFKVDFIAPEYEIPMQVDPNILFINKPSSRDDIDANGFRRVYKKAPATDGQEKVILFLGDTETFGYGVHFDETFVSIAASKLGDGYLVKNLGVVGYGPDQSWLQLKNYLDEFKRPDAIVLTIAAGNDFEDAFRNNIIGTDFSGNTNINQINTVSAFYPRFRFSLFFRSVIKGENTFPADMFREILADRPGLLSDLPVEEADRRRVLFYKSLQEIRTLMGDDIKALVPILPPLCKGKMRKPTICSSNINEAAKIIEEADLTFYNLFKTIYKRGEDPTTSFFKENSHLNTVGHQRIGERLSGVIQRELLGKRRKKQKSEQLQ